MILDSEPRGHTELDVNTLSSPAHSIATEIRVSQKTFAVKFQIQKYTSNSKFLLPDGSNEIITSSGEAEVCNAGEQWLLSFLTLDLDRLEFHSMISIH